jgi:hypothetical protein
MDEIESILNDDNPITIKDKTDLHPSQKIVSLPSLVRTPVTFEREGLGPLLRYQPPRPGLSTTLSTTLSPSPEETPVNSKQSLTADLRRLHESTSFHKDFEALIAIESQSQGTLNAILSNHFQILTDHQRLSEEQATEMIFNFIEHVKVQDEPLISRPVLQQLERIIDQVTTLTITQALYRIRSIVLSHIPKRKRIILKAWMAHLCRLSQAVGRDLLSGFSVVFSDLQFRSIRITSGDDEWEKVLRFMKKENHQMEYMSNAKTLQETVMDMHGPLNIHESVIEFLLRYSRAVL